MAEVGRPTRDRSAFAAGSMGIGDNGRRSVRVWVSVSGLQVHVDGEGVCYVERGQLCAITKCTASSLTLKTTSDLSTFTIFFAGATSSNTRDRVFDALMLWMPPSLSQEWFCNWDELTTRTWAQVDQMGVSLALPHETARAAVSEPLGEDYWLELEALGQATQTIVGAAEGSSNPLAMPGCDVASIVEMAEKEKEENKCRIGQLPPRLGGPIFNFSGPPRAPSPRPQRPFDFKGDASTFVSDVMTLTMVPINECTRWQLHDRFSRFGRIAQIAIGHPSVHHDCRNVDITFFSDESASNAVRGCATAFGHFRIVAQLGPPSNCSEFQKVCYILGHMHVSWSVYVSTTEQDSSQGYVRTCAGDNVCGVPNETEQKCGCTSGASWPPGGTQ